MFRYRLNNLNYQGKFRKSISNPTFQNQISRRVTKMIIMKKDRNTTCDRGAVTGRAIQFLPGRPWKSAKH